MHLLIDGQALQANHVKGRGIGRYSSNLIDGLLALGKNAKIELILHTDLEIPRNIPNGISTLLFPSIPTAKTISTAVNRKKWNFCMAIGLATLIRIGFWCPTQWIMTFWSPDLLRQRLGSPQSTMT